MYALKLLKIKTHINRCLFIIDCQIILISFERVNLKEYRNTVLENCLRSLGSVCGKMFDGRITLRSLPVPFYHTMSSCQDVGFINNCTTTEFLKALWPITVDKIDLPGDTVPKGTLSTNYPVLHTVNFSTPIAS